MHVILTSAQFALKDPATVSDLTQLRAHTTWLLGLMDALSTDDYAWSDKVRQRGAGRGGALVCMAWVLVRHALPPCICVPPSTGANSAPRLHIVPHL